MWSIKMRGLKTELLNFQSTVDPYADVRGCATSWSAYYVIMEEENIKPGILEKPVGVPLRDSQSTCGSSTTRRRGTLRSRRPHQPYGDTPGMPMEEV